MSIGVNHPNSAIVSEGDEYSLEEFYNTIDDKNPEWINKVDDIFHSNQPENTIILGKIISVQKRVPFGQRRDIFQSANPATFILMREVIKLNDTICYGAVYKVKFLGSIAKALLEANVKVGDRIAIENITAVQENTDYRPSTLYSTLTPIVLDHSNPAIFIGKKVGVRLNGFMDLCDTFQITVIKTFNL